MVDIFIIDGTDQRVITAHLANGSDNNSFSPIPGTKGSSFFGVISVGGTSGAEIPVGKSFFLAFGIGGSFPFDQQRNVTQRNVAFYYLRQYFFTGGGQEFVQPVGVKYT